MDRITLKHLEALCARINRLQGMPLDAYSKDGDKYRANIGNYHLDQAYGGVQLVRMVTDGGGVSCPLSNGHVSKRELYELMHAYIRGLEDGRARHDYQRLPVPPCRAI